MAVVYNKYLVAALIPATPAPTITILSCFMLHYKLFVNIRKEVTQSKLNCATAA
jgi:hypothetical protein